MLRDAGLLDGKAGRGGVLGSIQQPCLSPKAHQEVVKDVPELLGGFLLTPPAEIRDKRSKSA